jgi:hypothetical protein
MSSSSEKKVVNVSNFDSEVVVQVWKQGMGSFPNGYFHETQRSLEFLLGHHFCIIHKFTMKFMKYDIYFGRT